MRRDGTSRPTGVVFPVPFICAPSRAGRPAPPYPIQPTPSHFTSNSLRQSHFHGHDSAVRPVNYGLESLPQFIDVRIESVTCHVTIHRPARNPVERNGQHLVTAVGGSQCQFHLFSPFPLGWRMRFQRPPAHSRFVSLSTGLNQLFMVSPKYWVNGSPMRP